MAILFIDGMDYYTQAAAEGAHKWTQIPYIIDSMASRWATGKGLRTGNANSCVTKVLSPSGLVVVLGAAIQVKALAAYGGFIVRSGTSTELCSVHWNADGRLEFRLGGFAGTLVETSTRYLAMDVWYHFELKVTLATDATGAYEVRVNGETWMDDSSVVTSASGTTWDRIYIGQNIYVDDLYILDGSGSHATTFLGDCRVETLMAQAGNGSNTGLTCGTGTDHGALVDDAGQPNGDTGSDYNYSATVGNKDTYNLANLATTSGTVYAVQGFLNAKKSDTGARSIAPVWRVGGADYDGATAALTTSYAYFAELREHTPEGSPADWTISSVNAMEFGAKVAA